MVRRPPSTLWPVIVHPSDLLGCILDDRRKQQRDETYLQGALSGACRVGGTNRREGGDRRSRCAPAVASDQIVVQSHRPDIYPH